MEANQMIKASPGVEATPQSVGAHLRHLRLRHGLTQQQAAAQGGYPQSFVSKLERGTNSLLSTYIDFARRALGTPVKFVLVPLDTNTASTYTEQSRTVGYTPGDYTWIEV